MISGWLLRLNVRWISWRSSEAKKINFSVKGEPYSIKSVIGITLLRILQEGCSNAIRHANSSYIKVVLQYEKNKIILLIEDDGIGFDSENIECEIKKDNSGFGLSMMKERVYLCREVLRLIRK